MTRIARQRVLIGAVVLAAGISAAANVRVIYEVLSGDVVRVGDSFVARLTGLRAPDRKEPLGQEIFEFTKREIEGRAVKLFTWTTDNTAAGIVHDEEGHAFVQIFYGKNNAVSFNEVLLKKGYARVDPKYLPDDLKHFLDLEREARAKGLGIWKADWPVATPDEAGFDARKLGELVSEIRRKELLPRLHYLLIVRHGRLVLDENFNGWGPDRLHTLQSVSKSFTSALVGIAIARGEFKGVDEKVLDFFPDMTGIANMDERKRALRLEDILTMRTGTDYNENGSGSPHERLNRLATGWDKFYLGRPMIQAPGTGFQYDSGGVILLSAMLKRRTGMHAAEYAERFLFKPLGIEKYFWYRNAEGHTHAGGGLALSGRDAAKLGQLYLQKGRWGGVQVLPEAWVRESFEMRVDLTPPGQPPSGYGYLWWIWAPDPRGKSGEYIYAARGRFGQYIIVVPEHDMVVVFLGDAKDRPEMGKPIEVFYDRVLTSLAPREPGPPGS
jgi:CubicO group peptidase (beta-lactamase class C family)/predicted RecA/RadA family phage recombinase